VDDVPSGLSFTPSHLYRKKIKTVTYARLHLCSKLEFRVDNGNGYFSLITAILPIQKQNIQLLLAIDIRHSNPVSVRYWFSVSYLHCNYAILECSDMHLILTEDRGNGAASERL
jgi:hypothetical protein